VTTAADLDAAKDRLVDSLSSARDVTRAAVLNDIAPAVSAAVAATRDASAPVYAEAASRTADAVSALRGSDAAKAIRNSDTVKSLRNKRRPTRRRWPLAAGLVGLGVAGAAVVKRRGKPAPPSYPVPTDIKPTSAASEATAADPASPPASN
jgi:hypothetical protein